MYVLFTIDVETRGSGRGVGNPLIDILGRVPGEDERFGLEKMMDILDRHGVKGTFFVNPYETPVYGEEVLSQACRTIVRRGHDLELHTHPKPAFGFWSMREVDRTTQTKVLKWGLEKIQGWVGDWRPVAHRAGAYAGNLDTLLACAAVGIPMDFSYNYSVPFWRPAQKRVGTFNRPVVVNGILEVPVTSYVQFSLGPWEKLGFVDLESSTLSEIRYVLRSLLEAGVGTAVVMMHSFSFVRNGVPDREVIGKFDQLLGMLVPDPRYAVVSARELFDAAKSGEVALDTSDLLPETGLVLTYLRAWARIDEGWRNTAVALAPIGIIVLLLLRPSKVLPDVLV
ncbi:polysaccharide deacetylase family protein [Deferrisoma camini]|uniref:polysaccharide deacetylase family protein n=1 Tax=Deferrisoma camini TaxID=1035120 RepID=UPI0009FEEBD1|nr:polysaccharide deacetylase family protein [Deferrisoma camini]